MDDTKEINNVAPLIIEEAASVTALPAVDAGPSPPARPTERTPVLRISPALRHWIWTIILCVAVSAGSIYLYDYKWAAHIAAIDVQGFVNQQRNLYVSGQLTSEQFRKNMDNLEKAVLSARSNEVILMGDTVIRNARVIDVPKAIK